MNEVSLKFFPKFTKNNNVLNILPRLKDEKTRSFTTIVLTLLAIIFFSLFAISPTIGTISDLQNQLANDKFIDQQLTKKITNLTSLQQNYSRIQNNIPIIFYSIPDNPSIPLLFGQIQSIIKNTGITIVRIQSFPVEVSNDNPAVTKYSSFAFTIDAIGTNQTINGLLLSLKKLNRIVTINGIVITTNSQSTNNMRINIQAKAYFKKV